MVAVVVILLVVVVVRRCLGFEGGLWRVCKSGFGEGWVMRWSRGEGVFGVGILNYVGGFSSWGGGAGCFAVVGLYMGCSARTLVLVLIFWD